MADGKKLYELSALERNKDADSWALDELHINMSNALIKQRHNLGLREKRVVAAAIAKLDSKRWGPNGPNRGVEVEISADEFGETFESENPWRDLQLGTQLLHKQSVTFKTGKKDARGGDIIRIVNWCDASQYKLGEGKVWISFTDHIAPHLLNLKKDYTSQRLKNASSLRSLYAWRLLDQLDRFNDPKAAKYNRYDGFFSATVTDLKAMLEVPEKYVWNDILRRALEPAFKELSATHNIEFNLTKTKRGRAIHSMKLTFRSAEQGDLFKG